MILGEGLEGIKKQEWDKWHVFMVDERKVAKTHTDSNYNAIKSSILKPETNHPEQQFHGINEQLSLEECAIDYENQLREAFDMKQTKNEYASFDLILLGMGPDGHTASLFPDHPLLDVDDGKWISSLDDSPKPPPERITMTLPLINHSRRIAFVATGAEKKTSFQRAIGIPSKEIPSSLIGSRESEGGFVDWFIDNSVLSSNY